MFTAEFLKSASAPKPNRPFWPLAALGVGLGFVHAGRPQIADDLFHAGGVLVGGGLLGQLVLHAGGAFVQHLEGAPTGAVARDRVGGEPLAVYVAAEVGTGVLGGIQIADQETVDRRQLGFVQLQRGRFGGRSGGGIGGRGGGGLFFLAAGGQGNADGQGQQQDLGFTSHRLLRPLKGHRKGKTPCTGACADSTPDVAAVRVSKVMPLT
jgi:hypothetical protein